MTIFWGFIILLIVIGLTIIGFVYKGKLVKYEELEQKLENAVKEYVDEKFLYPNEGEKVKITLQELISENKLDSLNLENDSCDGYGIVSFNGNTFDYKVYLKCDYYQTKNYNKN